MVLFLAALLMMPCSLATTNPNTAANTSKQILQTTVASTTTRTTTLSVTVASTPGMSTTITNVGSCPRGCDVGSGSQTCDEIIRQTRESSCENLELQGCTCDGLVDNVHECSSDLRSIVVCCRFSWLCNFVVAKNALHRHRSLPLLL